MIDKVQCLYLYLLLYGGAILALFVRAFFRRRLLEDYRRLHGVLSGHPNENLIRKVLLAVPRQVRTLRRLGQTLGTAPPPVRRRYRWLRVLTGIAIALLAGLLVFSFTAHRICGA